MEDFEKQREEEIKKNVSKIFDEELEKKAPDKNEKINDEQDVNKECICYDRMELELSQSKQPEK